MALNVHLGLLEGAGLIQVASVQPELEYLFRHALVKDAAYQSLVKGSRRSLHRAVAQVLEQQYAAPGAAALPGERYHLLAFHFAEAGDAARAQRYFTLAGESAASSYANLEASAHFAQAIEAASRAGAPAADLIHLYARLGRVQELSGDYDRALATYARLETQGIETSEPAMVLAAITLQAFARAVPSAATNSAQADQLTTRALELAHELGDKAGEARALWARMLYEILVGRNSAAAQTGQAALTLAREVGLAEETALILNDLGRAYTGSGQFEPGLAKLLEARDLLRNLGNQGMLHENLSNTAAAYFMRGDYARALGLLDEAQAVSQAIGNAWGQSYSLMLRGYVMFELGSLQAGFDALEASLKLATEADFVAPLVEGRAALGLAYANLGHVSRARREIQAAREVVGDEVSPVLSAVRSVEAIVQVLAGDLEAAAACLAAAPPVNDLDDLTTFAPVFRALAEGELGRARGDFAQAAEAPADLLAFEREAGVHVFRIDLTLLRAKGLIGLGRLDEAEALLEEARVEAEQRQTHSVRWDVWATQAEIADRRGDVPRAAQLRAAARQVLRSVADGLRDPELRRGLLDRPVVRALFGPVEQPDSDLG